MTESVGRKRIATLDDWVCHPHNRKLERFRGRARCPVTGCTGWLTEGDVATIRLVEAHYALDSEGHVFRNIKIPCSEEERRLMNYIEDVDLSAPNVAAWWHMFGGTVPLKVDTEEVESLGKPEVEVRVYISAVVGPVLEHADGVFASTGEPVKNGIVLAREDMSAHITLRASWTHAPTDKEMEDAEGEGIAAEVVQGYRPLRIYRTEIGPEFRDGDPAVDQ